MNDSRAPEPWIGGPATGTGCRLRWDVNGPACGAPVTLHVISESAMYGVQCLPTCERHAPVAREAGAYLREHSPSFPGCDCAKLATPQPLAQQIDPVDTLRGIEITLPTTTEPPKHGIGSHLPRPPYDPDLERRMRESRTAVPYASDGLTHYLTDRGHGAVALCGAGAGTTAAAGRDYVLSRNWRIVSCPTCRTTETPR